MTGLRWADIASDTEDEDSWTPSTRSLSELGSTRPSQPPSPRQASTCSGADECASSAAEVAQECTEQDASDKCFACLKDVRDPSLSPSPRQSKWCRQYSRTTSASSMCSGADSKTPSTRSLSESGSTRQASTCSGADECASSAAQVVQKSAEQDASDKCPACVKEEKNNEIRHTVELPANGYEEAVKALLENVKGKIDEEEQQNAIKTFDTSDVSSQAFVEQVKGKISEAKQENDISVVWSQACVETKGKIIDAEQKKNKFEIISVVVKVASVAARCSASKLEVAFSGYFTIIKKRTVCEHASQGTCNRGNDQCQFCHCGLQGGSSATEKTKWPAGKRRKGSGRR